MHPNIENKVAVVTGGSRGIGFCIAGKLVQEGAFVVIGSRHQDSVQEAVKLLQQQAPGRVAGFATDVRQYQQVEQLMLRAEEQFGGVDILVNNAGIGIFGPVEQLTPEEWDAVIETNLSGCFYAIRAAVPRMKRRGGGYIFNISSLAGKNPLAGGAAYNASKFGLNGFSEAAMMDLRYDNIRVSYILPGSVETSFGRRPPAAAGHSSRASWKLHPDDVAQTVIDLLRFDARAMLSRVELRPSKPPRK